MHVDAHIEGARSAGPRHQKEGNSCAEGLVKLAQLCACMPVNIRGVCLGNSWFNFDGPSCAPAFYRFLHGCGLLGRADLALHSQCLCIWGRYIGQILHCDQCL